MSKFTKEQVEAMQAKVLGKRLKMMKHIDSGWQDRYFQGVDPVESDEPPSRFASVRWSNEIVLAIPMLAPGLNGNNGLIRMHFTTYKKVKDKWTRAIRERCNARASTPCSILVERYYATHAMDLDNLYSTVKIPLDALRSSGVIPEDDPSCVEALKVVQIKVAKKVDQHTRITITSIPKE